MSKNKTIWIIEESASTPEAGRSGRSFYIAKSLASLGYKVYVIAASFTHLLRNPVKVNGLFEVEEVDKNFNFVWLDMPEYPEAHSKKRILNWFNFAYKLPKLVGKLPNPDIVIYSSPSLIGYLGAERISKKLSVPLVFEVRDIWPLTLCEVGGYSTSHPFIIFLKYIEMRAYKNSDFIISNLKNLDQHIESLNIKPKSFAWIPNGFSKEEVENAEPLDNSTIEQLPKNKFIIGYTGTIGVANSLDTLIEVAYQLKDYKEIAFVLVGHGKEKNDLQENVIELGLNNVHFIDSIPKVQIQSMLNMFDACYIGLKKEPLFRFGVSPNKLFDYLYSGRPIIYAIDSGKYRPVEESKAGIQVEPENVDNIAKAILDIYNMTPEERREMGQNGHKVALESYEYGSLAKTLSAILFKQ